MSEDDAAAIAAEFTEFAPFAGAFRYRDCTRIHPPGCAASIAVDVGVITPSRYASSVGLLGGDREAPTRLKTPGNE